MLLIVRLAVMTAKLHDRHEPVPVQHGHVGVVIGRGMPAEQVIVVTADLAGCIMVADIMIVGLGQWHVNEAENQHSDSQGPCGSRLCRPYPHHVVASIPGGNQRLQPLAWRVSAPVTVKFLTTLDYEPGL